MKKWLRKISLCLIFAIVFACAASFIACDDDDGCGGGTDIDTPDDDDDTPNIDQLSYYTLPGGFYLKLEDGSGYVANFIKLPGIFYTDSLNSGKYSAKYLVENTDGTFTKLINSGEGWQTTDTALTALAADKDAYLMFSFIIHTASGFTDDTINVGGENVLCDSYTNSRGNQYWLAKGYNFWVKNTNGFYATALNLNLTDTPEGIDFPVLTDNNNV